jgi:hypothetical protein
MSAARKGAAYGALTERERARLRAAYATVPASRWVADIERGRAYRGRGRRAWCRRCRALTVAVESGRCVQCGGGLAAGYEWVEAE